MMDFFTWLEEKSDIRIVSYDKTGQITFFVNGKKYTYIMDAGYFYNGFFKNWIKYKPGKALNFAKQNGELLEPKQTKKPQLVQKSLFHY